MIPDPPGRTIGQAFAPFVPFAGSVIQSVPVALISTTSMPTTHPPNATGMALDMGCLSETLLQFYDQLFHQYGPQHWWPAQTRFEVIVGAILTQSVAWSNVERAIAHLKAAQALEPAALDALPMDELARCIRPAGYYNAKARKIQAFVAHLRERYRYDLEALLSREIQPLRQELLSLHGIGPETADSIILYAAGQPVFVIDAYTRRLFSRLGLVSDTINYDDLQDILEGNLPREVPLFQEYHALIVQHGKSVCRKQPLCTDCCLRSLCGSRPSENH